MRGPARSLPALGAQMPNGVPTSPPQGQQLPPQQQQQQLQQQQLQQQQLQQQQQQLQQQQQQQQQTTAAAAGVGNKAGDDVPIAPFVVQNGNEVYRPDGVVKDGSFGKNKNMQWCLLFRDRLEVSPSLPLKGKAFNGKKTMLAETTVERASPSEVVIKDKKNKKIFSLTDLAVADGDEWMKYIGAVLSKLPKAPVKKIVPKGDYTDVCFFFCSYFQY